MVGQLEDIGTCFQKAVKVKAGWYVEGSFAEVCLKNQTALDYMYLGKR
jgi:hypothetical protein